MQNSESLNFSKLSQNHIQKLKGAFQMIDDDGDGIITQEDLSTIFRSIGKQNNDEQIATMLKGACSENSNGITFPEFLSLMGETLGEFPEDTEMMDCLRSLSGNDDLQISLDDLVVHLKEAGFQNPEKEFEKLFKDFTAKNQITNDKTFKGDQFINMISE